jgi:hypothetical protein
MSDLVREMAGEWKTLVAGLAPLPEVHPLRRPREARVPMSPAALLAELEDVRRSWNVLLRSPKVKRRQDRYLSTHWTLKELLAHLASWAGEFRHEIERTLRGDTFDYVIPFALSAMGPGEWNQREVDKRRELSLTAIREEFDRETRGLEELLLEAPPERLFRRATFPLAPSGNPASLWSGPPALIVAGKCVHDRHHLAQIEAWLSSPGGAGKSAR